MFSALPNCIQTSNVAISSLIFPATKNVRERKLNVNLAYLFVRLANNTCADCGVVQIYSSRNSLWNNIMQANFSVPENEIKLSYRIHVLGYVAVMHIQ